MELKKGDIVELDTIRFMEWYHHEHGDSAVAMDVVILKSDPKRRKMIDEEVCVANDDYQIWIPIWLIVPPEGSFEDRFEIVREDFSSGDMTTLRLVDRKTGGIVSWRSGWTDRIDAMTAELVKIGEELMESERET